MKWERKIVENGNSLQFTIPIDLAKYLGLDKGDLIELQDDKGKHGSYGSFWKKE